MVPPPPGVIYFEYGPPNFFRTNLGSVLDCAIAMLLGVPTGIANVVQGLSGPKPRWILKGKLQPQSPQANAQYGWIDRTDGKTEGPFRAEMLKQ